MCICGHGFRCPSNTNAVPPSKALHPTEVNMWVLNKSKYEFMVAHAG